MVGDTKLDLISASNASINSVGVLCGYSNEEELLKYTNIVKRLFRSCKTYFTTLNDKNIFSNATSALLVAFVVHFYFYIFASSTSLVLGSIFCYKHINKISKIPIQSPKLFSAPARILIGLAIGSAFTPAILNYIPQYTISLLLVVPFTIFELYFWNILLL